MGAAFSVRSTVKVLYMSLRKAMARERDRGIYVAPLASPVFMSASRTARSLHHVHCDEKTKRLRRGGDNAPLI